MSLRQRSEARLPQPLTHSRWHLANLLHRDWTRTECFSERQSNGCYRTLVIEGAGSARAAWSRVHRPGRQLSRLLAGRRADTDKGRVIGTATLFVERKYIRACGKAGDPIG